MAPLALLALSRASALTAGKVGSCLCLLDPLQTRPRGVACTHPARPGSPALLPACWQQSCACRGTQNPALALPSLSHDRESPAQQPSRRPPVFLPSEAAAALVRVPRGALAAGKLRLVVQGALPKGSASSLNWLHADTIPSIADVQEPHSPLPPGSAQTSPSTLMRRPPDRAKLSRAQAPRAPSAH